MRIRKYIILLSLLVSCLNCKDDESLQNFNTSLEEPTYKYLALGDSYTIGQSVCSSCSFPSQLKDSLNDNLDGKTALRSIAVTGWTTSDLLNATSSTTVATDYDMVTLLIGINNQFQGKPFTIYESEFALLLDKAILYAGGDATNVLVLSIPDYAYTPFGENSADFDEISQEIDSYNNFAFFTTVTRGASFENITPISRQGLSDNSLIASDGLHLSAKAYNKIIKQIYNRARIIITSS